MVELPPEFAEPAVQAALSFNGQLHFICANCNEVTWAEVTYGKSVLSGEATPACPHCRIPRLQLVKFDLQESHVSPPFPKRLFALPDGEQVLGESVESDVRFLVEYIRALRRSPESHATCVHFVRFIESVFDHVYGAAEAATDILNVASGMMRTIYRETGDLDAACVSISLMARARDITSSAVQRAVYGLNISQTLYSVLAREQEQLVGLRLGVDVKPYALRLSRESLLVFERKPQLAELRAHQKWLLGDILKSGKTSESELREALVWLDAALNDPGLPESVVPNVRESQARTRLRQMTSMPE